MEPVIRAAVIYAAILLFFRLAGRRTVAELTNFDFVLLLIVSECTQQALLGEDFSVTTALLAILTLVMLDVALGLLKQYSRRLDKWSSGEPLVIVEDGRPNRYLMNKARIREDEVLEAARLSQGLERMDQIKFAILERNGGISIIPKGK